MTEICTDRLTLRAARDDDLGPLFRIFSDPRAMRYWSSPPHTSQDETRRILAMLKSPEKKDYFIFDHGGAVIGLGGIAFGTEIGFILHSDHWGQGFAPEAISAIAAHIWATTDFPRITADADPRNLRSVGLLTRLGFHVTGFARDTFCVSGEWSDSVYLALPRPASAPTAQ